MEKFSSLFPKINQLICREPSIKDTFLFDSLENIKYPFWAELEYFLANCEYFGDTDEILRKLLSVAPFSLDIMKAWEKQSQFRSSQFEITSIYLIENYLGGKVKLIPEDKVPTPDFKTTFNQGSFMVEAKAQSGQQKGDKHPRHNRPILFDPKEEIDLRSWLFEEKISSRNGRAMKPQVLAAEDKGADILVCQTGYVKTQDDLQSQISILCPENQIIGQMRLPAINRNPLDVIFFQVKFPCAQQLTKLKEIWLCYLSSSHYRLVVLSQENTILSDHLNLQDNRDRTPHH